MVIISCSLKGFEAADKLSLKLNNFKEIKNALLFIEREMQFSKATLPEIFKNASALCERKLIKEILFNTYKKSKGDFSIFTAWQKEIEQNQKRLCLSKKETLVIKNIFKGIGMSDSHTQEKLMANIIEVIDENIKRCESTYQINAKMYRSMGVLCGVFIALLFI